MKTTFTTQTTQRNAASTLHASHSTHTAYSPLRRLTLLVTLLMTFALGARAQSYYVFYYEEDNGTRYYINNNNGSISAENVFSPTCVWVASSALSTGTNNSNKRSLYSYKNNSFFLVASGNDVTISDNSSDIWKSNEGYLLRRGNSNYYYVYYENGSFKYSNSSGTYGSKRVKAVTVTVATNQTETSTVISATPTIQISPESLTLASTGQFQITASSSSITQTTVRNTYTKYTFNGDEVHKEITNTQTTGLGTTFNLTSYQWAVTGDGATYIKTPSGTSTNGNVTLEVNTYPTTTQTATFSVRAVYGDNIYTTEEATALITISEKLEDPERITAEPLTLAVDEQKAISYTLQPSNANRNIAYSGYDNTLISIDANGIVKGLKAGKTTVTLTAKKLDGTNGPTTTCNVTVTPKAPSIEFSLGTGITATISTTETDAKIYYTTDGTEPTTSSTRKQYTAPFAVEAGKTVKAIVIVTVNGEQLVSPVAESLANAGSGIIGNTVYLYDLEDHNWTYYQQSSNLPSGYPTTYLSSPNPRNVKITYNGENGVLGSSTNVQVSISEKQNSFVYYKTLEQGSTQNEYPYTVISNPFSVRPSTGSGNSKVYYGFAGWKIISGGEYIKSYNNNDVLPLDANIVFENLPYNSVNCISANIVFETTWKQANRTYVSSNPNSDQTYSTDGDYESNFYVINCDYTRAITASGPVTIMMVEPDGSVDYRSKTFSGSITPTANGNTKIEFAHWKPGSAINPQGRNFTIGRGMTMDGTKQALYGINSSTTMNQILKVESGSFSSLINYNAKPSSITKHWTILGCDYDRAKEVNDNLIITGEMRLMKSSIGQINSTAGKELAIITAKSGTFTSGLTHTSARESANCFYLWDASSSNTQVGYRKLEIEGGIFWNIGGGMDKSNSTDRITLEMRIKGGTIKGAIFGGGATYDAHGHRLFVCTGGKIGGWIAPGANGIVTSGTSLLDGKSFVYIGGRTRVDSQYADYEKIDNSTGGNVFGAGCGYSSESTRGRVEQGTNVVIADEAYVQRGVYGGGAYGYCKESETANIYITGGHIGSVYDDQFDVYGGVYGGARQNRGGTVNIYMTGGQIDGQKQGGTSGGGVYGVSNVTGTISGNVTMNINGGQVGTSSASANIHGGGYGQNTAVSGNVTLTLGANTTDPGVTVYGDVYGGSALGTVNDASSDKTKVTLNCGTINGSLYGGGLGDATEAANVYGAVTVTVNGGSVKKTSVEGSGGVYGANNIKGAPQSSVTVDIYGTDPAPAEGQYALYAVYGGGNNADYTYGNGYPKVTVHKCDNSIEYIYGGGNAAAVAATDVTIYGGDVIGNVFGGGNGTVSPANVNGDATTKIYGGTILNVYGGSNAAGTINGDINLTINSMKEEGSSDKQPCTMDIGSVYGGGNLADMNGNISVSLGCINHIKELYGGARNANIGTDTQNSNINLAITSGHFDRVFGGNNLGGAIKGSITVNIEETGCNPITIGELYGGGNLAAYSVYGYDAEGNYKESGTKLYNDPVVNILSFSSIGRVFGGGLGNKAVMVGSPTVNINEDVGTNANNTEWPYLGQTISYTDKSSVTLPTRNSGAIGAIGTVFGGGNAAPVIGNTQVNIGTTTGKADIRGNVYGGGNQAKVTGKTNVVIGQGN